MLRVGKHTEIRLVVVKGLGKEERGKYSKIVMMVPQLCEYILKIELLLK
jgi:hypothetical protein